MLPRSLNLPMVAEIDTEAEGGALTRAVRVKFRYRADDPYAVVLDFATGVDDWVRWTLARDLLAQGLHAGAGEGDVLIGPDGEAPGRVWITVSSPTGTARFAFRRADLAAALAKTQALVPPGSESVRIDWDRELALLGGEAA
jgi:hypothetical protein